MLSQLNPSSYDLVVPLFSSRNTRINRIVDLSTLAWAYLPPAWLDPQGSVTYDPDFHFDAFDDPQSQRKGTTRLGMDLKHQSQA